MNKIFLVGRLANDPEARYTSGDSPMCVTSYTIAVGRKSKREGLPDADFIRCKAFGRPGEFAHKYFSKGLRVAVVGRLQTGSYTNRNGEKVYTTEVIIEDQEFAQSKNEKQHDEEFNSIDNIAQQELPFI